MFVYEASNILVDDKKIVQQNLGEFKEDLELDFKLFFFVDSGSAYIVLEKSE